jgi:hypothetical protein
MIRTTAPLMMAALGLIMSALTAQAANPQLATTQAAKASTTPILYLPYPITAPGTYVVTKNLTFSATANVAAITISTAIRGPVIVDLKGFTLTGAAGNSVGVGIGSFAGTQSIPNTSPITVRNGALTNFGFGVWAENGAVLSSIDLQNVAIRIGGTSGVNNVCVLFSQVELSTISNCSFTDGSIGIEDTQSPGGNIYANDTFTNVTPLFVTGQNGGISSVLNRCVFQAPAN